MSSPRQRKSGSSPKRRPPKPLRRSPTAFELYCDESGNVGPDYLNVDQPHHVAGGWLVESTKLSEFDVVWNDLIGRDYGAEVKASAVLRRGSGVRKVAELIKSLRSIAYPMFVIANRRFCLAGKAVDVYCDPFTNPAAGWLPTGAMAVRNEMWEVVSRLPDAVLSRFAVAYRDPTVTEMSAVAGDIAKGLEEAGAPSNLVHTFRAAGLVADEICEAEYLQGDTVPHGVAISLNTPAFFHVAKKADRIAEYSGAKLTIVHDEIPRHQDLFRKAVVDMALSGDESLEYRGTRGEMVRLGVRRGTVFRTETSASSTRIQAADLLVGSVRRLAHDALKGHEFDKDWMAVASETIPALMSPEDGIDPMLAGMLASGEERSRLIVPVMLSRMSTPHE